MSSASAWPSSWLCGVFAIVSSRTCTQEPSHYSDVTVVSPYGEIAWDRLSRLSDDEMRELMIDVVDRCYGFPKLVTTASGRRMVDQLRERDQLPR